MDKSNAAKVFNLKNKLIGGKKKPQEPTAIKDPHNGDIITDPVKIKSTLVKFCKDLLTNKDPSPGFENDLLLKRKLHDLRMKENIEGVWRCSTNP